MKKLVAACVVILVAAVAVQFASSAPSTPASIPTRVKALEAKVKSLTASVKTLKTDVATLKTRSNCLSAQGLTQYGNPAGNSGYVYTPDGGTTLALTTALDFPASGQTPSFYAARINPACVTTSASAGAFSLGRAAAPHRTAPIPSP